MLLSPERDEQLAQLTEHRVTAFAHDLVPNYLRTKLEPMAESKMLQLEHKAATLTCDNAQVSQADCSPFVIIYYIGIILLETSCCISKSSLSCLGYSK